jgi:hypothetical protein
MGVIHQETFAGYRTNKDKKEIGIKKKYMFNELELLNLST